MTDPTESEDDSLKEPEGAALVDGDAESDATEPDAAEPDTATRRTDWQRVLAYGILPGLALLLTLAAGFSKGQEALARSSRGAAAESLAAAKESTIAILSYQPDSVEKTMVAARERLTPPYKDAYTKLTNDVVIPGARHDRVSVTATIPAAASVSATPLHAVAILFVNQAAAIGVNPPTSTESSILVTLDKIRGHWLISGFDPV